MNIRHDGKTYTGTRLPFDTAEMVDDAGAIFQIQGGVRLLTSDLAKLRPKAGDEIQIKNDNSGAWITYVIVSARLDEIEATMLITYGERYDQDGM